MPPKVPHRLKAPVLCFGTSIDLRLSAAACTECRELRQAGLIRHDKQSITCGAKQPGPCPGLSQSMIRLRYRTL
ncbi:hypothetical protein AMS68_002682 [Peltaster fructicola]|uniref:Uncharacterized protein n=1 Tax=Peltaster fructicola TaxID=286661 RepID=A0A6H0XRA6_9PEZI|nr:hypothetical protein AMS68_002682 [Peltaster fructicola]